MTRNQISYLEHLESKRHNLATEGEAKRSNLAKEQLQHVQNIETERSHRASEAYNLDSLSETKRSHQMSELLSSLDLQEKHRSNVAQEELKAAANYIQNLYNQGRLSIEQQKVDESIRQFNLGTGLRYGSSALGAGLGYLAGKGATNNKWGKPVWNTVQGTAATKAATSAAGSTSGALGTLGALGTMALMTGGAIYLGSNFSSKNPNIFKGGKNKDG